MLPRAIKQMSRSRVSVCFQSGHVKASYGYAIHLLRLRGGGGGLEGKGKLCLLWRCGKKRIEDIAKRSWEGLFSGSRRRVKRRLRQQSGTLLGLYSPPSNGEKARERENAHFNFDEMIKTNLNFNGISNDFPWILALKFIESWNSMNSNSHGCPSGIIWLFAAILIIALLPYYILRERAAERGFCRKTEAVSLVMTSRTPKIHRVLSI